MTGRKRRGVLAALGAPGRRSTRFRGLALVGVLALLGAILLPHLAAAADPYTQISPESKDARDIQVLYKIVFWIALFVFIGVQAAISLTYYLLILESAGWTQFL